MSNSSLDSHFDTSVQNAVESVMKKYNTKGDGVLSETDIRKILDDGYQKLRTKRRANDDDVKRFL